MINFNVRGSFGTVKEINVGGITSKLKPKYRHQVLVLDTTEKDEEYELVHAIDSLNSMGWCKFDDIKACIGKQNALKVVAYCEGRVRAMAKKAAKKAKKSKE